MVISFEFFQPGWLDYLLLSWLDLLLCSQMYSRVYRSIYEAHRIHYHIDTQNLKIKILNCKDHIRLEWYFGSILSMLGKTIFCDKHHDCHYLRVTFSAMLVSVSLHYYHRKFSNTHSLLHTIKTTTTIQQTNKKQNKTPIWIGI